MCPLSEVLVVFRPVFAQRRSGGMAYASVSKTDSRKGVGVRVPPSAFQRRNRRLPGHSALSYMASSRSTNAVTSAASTIPSPVNSQAQ